MVCQRCRGLMVCETFHDLCIEIDSRYLATRCINCGCVEDAVVRANRVHRFVKAQGRVRKNNVVCIAIHSKEYASI